MPVVARPVIGEPAPPLSLVSPAGEPWELQQHLGSHVVLIFHRHIH